MDTTALLVKESELKTYLAAVLKEEEEVVRDLEKILPYLENPTLKRSIERRLSNGKECLEALRGGFVPVQPGYFTRVDTKEKWQKKAVKEALATMPEEVKEVWEKVKAMGIFKSFSITTGGGDPVLVGSKGGRLFFIGGWLPITRRVAFGVRVRLPMVLHNS